MFFESCSLHKLENSYSKANNMDWIGYLPFESSKGSSLKILPANKKNNWF